MPYVYFNLMMQWCSIYYKCMKNIKHDDVIKWKHIPRYWPFVRGIHRSPVNSPHKGQWRGALMFSLICARINSWVNNGEAGDLRRHRGHYDVIVIIYDCVAYLQSFNTLSLGYTTVRELLSRLLHVSMASHIFYNKPLWKYMLTCPSHRRN